MTSNPVEYITLVSMEGHEFVIDRNCAKLSGTINSMLAGAFLEGTQGRITFQEISTPVLGMAFVCSLYFFFVDMSPEKVIQYLYYKAKYSMNTQTIPAFTMEPEIGMSLLHRKFSFHF